MKKYLLVFLCVSLLAGALLCVPVFADSCPFVTDSAELFSEEELVSLSDAAKTVSWQTECQFSIVTYDSTGRGNYIGETFLKEHSLSGRTDLILLIVSKDGSQYFYDLYLYGSAEKHITQEEADRILDTPSVYNNIKSGKVYTGVAHFLTTAAQEYENGVNRANPYLKALPAALVIAVVVGVICCVCIKLSYSMKKRSVDYPLEQFAKMDLTEKEDVFTGSFVTKRVISSGSGGSGGGSGGSHHSSHGGGSGHAGGR